MTALDMPKVVRAWAEGLADLDPVQDDKLEILLKVSSLPEAGRIQPGSGRLRQQQAGLPCAG